MIDELHVQDVALIHDATICPAEGLTVLTGETGAGKSALLSSIKLLMGERADAGAVREGADALVVEGRLYVDEDDRDGMVVRRRVAADGRGRVAINGRMASVRELAEKVGTTIDLCGQHEHQRLLQQASHVHLLDSWAGEQVGTALAAYQEALKQARDAAAELSRVQKMCKNAADRVDEATFVLSRIDEVNPREGELEELEDELPRAEHAEALMMAANNAREALTTEDGALDLINEAMDEIRSVARYDDRLRKLASTLESALIDVEDAASELRDYRDSVDLDVDVLEQMQTRMSQLRGLMRSYGPGMEEVFARREQAMQLVAAAQNGDEMLRKATNEVKAAERRLSGAADMLDAARQKEAPRFAALVSEQMSFLEMGTAQLDVSMERLDRAQWSAAGPSRVELLYRPAAGMTARPLRRIASGGEVSRVMLACKVVLGESDATQTLVFDEVDAGVGGATAVALASVLARLAQTHQVIVVTHLPQVAVRGTCHYLVRKTPAVVEGDVPQTTIVPIEGEERVAEIARMLSGDTSQMSLAHARDMLANGETIK
ncbi:MAG: DNA repair protein RecN [Coriobacteriales bacterium]|nr:DNA repair protein RecN [Coriobacteriales bacterium]